MFKYRAKNLKGEWVKGSKLEIANSAFIVPENTKWVKIFDRSHIHWDSIVEIDPSTLGVCWGRKDKNNNDIYTRMAVKVPAGFYGDYHYNECVATVVFEDDEFSLWNTSDPHGVVWQDFQWEQLEIIEEE